MKITNILSENVTLTKPALRELERFLNWATEVVHDIDETGKDGLEFGRLRVLATIRLNNRERRDQLSPADIKDFKRIRGLGVSAQGLETMYLDRLI